MVENNCRAVSGQTNVLRLKQKYFSNPLMTNNISVSRKSE
jgi:hypothetical protein